MRQSHHFATDFDSVAAAGGHFDYSFNTELAADILAETFELLTKSCAQFKSFEKVTFKV